MNYDNRNAEWATLVNPENPENPENPVNPVNPENPVNPKNPVNPVNPVNPINPGNTVLLEITPNELKILNALKDNDPIVKSTFNTLAKQPLNPHDELVVLGFSVEIIGRIKKEQQTKVSLNEFSNLNNILENSKNPIPPRKPWRGGLDSETIKEYNSLMRKAYLFKIFLAVGISASLIGCFVSTPGAPLFGLVFAGLSLFGIGLFPGLYYSLVVVIEVRDYIANIERLIREDKITLDLYLIYLHREKIGNNIPIPIPNSKKTTKNSEIHIILKLILSTRQIDKYLPELFNTIMNITCMTNAPELITYYLKVIRRIITLVNKESNNKIEQIFKNNYETSMKACLIEASKKEKGNTQNEKWAMIISDIETIFDSADEDPKYVKEPLILMEEHSGGKKPRKSLDKCTVAELKEKAKKRSIKINGLKKDEIIAKLRKNRK